MTNPLRWAWAVALLATAPLVVYGVTFRTPERLVDFAVYRRGGEAVLHGQPLYGFVTDHGLPFTYPPVAGLLAVPFAALTTEAAGACWLVVALLAFAFCAHRLVAAAGLPAWWGPVLLVAVGWSEPVRDVFRFGQVGTVLMALVVADLTRSHGRARGALLGLAAAVKLTPALFVPVLLFAGRRRDGVTATVAAGALTAAAAVVLPQDSWRAWTGAVFDVGRLGAAGGSANPGNQSVHGALLRAGVAGWWWLPLVAVLLIVGLTRAARAMRAGDVVLAIAVTGCLSVAVSPVSWIHHLVWVLPVAVVLVRDRRWLPLALGAAVFWPRTPWLATEYLSGRNAYRPLGLLWQDAMLILACAVVLGLRPRRRSGVGSAVEGEHLDEPGTSEAPGVALDLGQRRGGPGTREAVELLDPVASLGQRRAAAGHKILHRVRRAGREVVLHHE